LSLACTSSSSDGTPISAGAGGSSAAGTSGSAGTSGAAGTGAAGTGAAGSVGSSGAAGTAAAAGTSGAAGTSAQPDGGTNLGDAAADKPPAGPIVWQQAAPCPIARFEAMTVVDGTKVIVLGGFVGNVTPTARVDVFDVETGQWSRRKDLPAPLTHAGVAPVDGGKVYFAGGFTGSFVQGIPQNITNVWIHDLAADTWTPGPALPTRRAAIALVRVGGLLHAIGGLGADSNSDIDEHLTLALEGGTSWTTAPPPLTNGRNHLGGVTIGDDIYVVGGRHGWDEQNGHQRTLNRLAGGATAWTSLASLDIGRSEIAASTFVAFGRVYVIGGSVMGVRPVPDVLRYDPATDKWAALTPLPAPRKGAVAAAVGNKIVVTTGSPTSTDPIATTWVGCCID
jgi:N-acetylneuraminic acid mutarotase